MDPWNAGCDLRADMEAGHAQRLHHDAGGFAAGHDEGIEAFARQQRRQLAEGALDRGAGFIGAELLLDLAEVAGSVVA